MSPIPKREIPMKHTKTIAALTTVAIALGSTGVASAHTGHAPTHKEHRSHVLERHLSKGLRHKIDRKVRHGHNGTNGAAGMNGVNGKDGLKAGTATTVSTARMASTASRATRSPPSTTPGSARAASQRSPARQSRRSPSAAAITPTPAQTCRDMAALHNGSGIVASFPGRMDWSTNTPKPNRNDGWVTASTTSPPVT